MYDRTEPSPQPLQWLLHSTHTPKDQALHQRPSLPGVSALFLFTACPLAGAAGFTSWAELELHFATMLNFSSKDSCTSAASCARSSEQTQERVCGVQRMHKQPVLPQWQQDDKETQMFKLFFCAVRSCFVRSQGHFQNKI